jgi:hypothetical protein
MYYRIKEMCIKLVIKTSLYYDTRSEKHKFIERVCVRIVSGPFVKLITGQQKSKLLSVVLDTVTTSPVQLVGGEHSWFLFIKPRVQICVQTPGTLIENYRDFPNILQEN